jgi:hypothetical protein
LENCGFIWNAYWKTALRQSFWARTIYKKYEKNTNKKKPTKILERNKNKNNESKGINNKTRIFIHFWVVGDDRRWSAVVGSRKTYQTFSMYC